jgi:membrane protein
LLFRFLPEARARWRDLWAGAIFTALLFGLGRFLIGFYIGNSDFSSTYGAAGALITLLVWTYYNSQILFLGAEFTQVWARWQGNPIVPTEYAVKVRQELVRIADKVVEPQPVEALQVSADDKVQSTK